MATNETTSGNDKCHQCRHTKLLGRKCIKPGECNVCVVVNETLDAYGEILMKHFPDAKYGDQSPLVVHALLTALESAAAEWISNNFPEDDDAQAA